ncbi:MAG TPA: hypothetical protein VEY30_12490, partial [Myxococcaceae bacterium]|nr:hypothetical protein [Myxococcaceae bacterium]
PEPSSERNGILADGPPETAGPRSPAATDRSRTPEAGSPASSPPPAAEDRFTRRDNLHEVAEHALSLIGAPDEQARRPESRRPEQEPTASPRGEDELQWLREHGLYEQFEQSHAGIQMARESAQPERPNAAEDDRAQERTREERTRVERDRAQDAREATENGRRTSAREAENRMRSQPSQLSPDQPTSVPSPRGENWLQWLREHGLYEDYERAHPGIRMARESADAPDAPGRPDEDRSRETTAPERSTDPDRRDTADDLRAPTRATGLTPEERRTAENLRPALPSSEVEDSFEVRDGTHDLHVQAQTLIGGSETELPSLATAPIFPPSELPASGLGAPGTPVPGWEPLPSGGLDAREPTVAPPLPDHASGLAPASVAPAVAGGPGGSPAAGFIPAHLGNMEGGAPLDDGVSGAPVPKRRSRRVPAVARVGTSRADEEDEDPDEEKRKRQRRADEPQQ